MKGLRHVETGSTKKKGSSGIDDPEGKLQDYLYELFDVIDANGGGTVSPLELCGWLRHHAKGLGITSNLQQQMQLCRELDVDGDGELDEDEFVSGMLKSTNVPLLEFLHARAYVAEEKPKPIPTRAPAATTPESEAKVRTPAPAPSPSPSSSSSPSSSVSPTRSTASTVAVVEASKIWWRRDGCQLGMPVVHVIRGTGTVTSLEEVPPYRVFVQFSGVDAEIHRYKEDSWGSKLYTHTAFRSREKQIWWKRDHVEVGLMVVHEIRGQGTVTFLEEDAPHRVFVQFEGGNVEMHRYREDSWGKKLCRVSVVRAKERHHRKKMAPERHALEVRVKELTKQISAEREEAPRIREHIDDYLLPERELLELEVVESEGTLAMARDALEQSCSAAGGSIDDSDAKSHAVVELERQIEAKETQLRKLARHVDRVERKLALAARRDIKPELKTAQRKLHRLRELNTQRRISLAIEERDILRIRLEIKEFTDGRKAVLQREATRRREAVRAALSSVNQNFEQVKKDLAESNATLHERSTEGRTARRELELARRVLRDERTLHNDMNAQVEELEGQRFQLDERLGEVNEAIRLLESTVVRRVGGRLQSLSSAVANEQRAAAQMHQAPSLDYFEEQLEALRVEGAVMSRMLEVARRTDREQTAICDEATQLVVQPQPPQLPKAVVRQQHRQPQEQHRATPRTSVHVNRHGSISITTPGRAAGTSGQR